MITPLVLVGQAMRVTMRVWDPVRGKLAHHPSSKREKKRKQIRHPTVAVEAEEEALDPNHVFQTPQLIAVDPIQQAALLHNPVHQCRSLPP